MNRNPKPMTKFVLTAAGLATAAAIVLSSGGQAVGRSGSDRYSNLPSELNLMGVCRDFRWRTEDNGHPDFQRQPASGFGMYTGNLAIELDRDGRPVFQGGGRKVSAQWRDSARRNINPAIYDASKGDTAGSFTGNPDPGGIASAESFAQWYRNVPGVNMTKEVPITLRRQEGTNMYVFDDRTDPLYSTRGGFFPVNNDLFGNSPGQSKNFGFTFEVATEFVYKPNENQSFTFIGDDDVWVFINNKLVIDIGGVHGATSQTVQLDRLGDLMRPNARNTLTLFFAERHTTQSNCRIETTINLRPAQLPNTASMYD
ncbi:MAG: fibro-slime domain-containing protein [Phycisphaerales bacterium]